ncbi:hypothetical protein HDC90_000518 [Pedobacter sp. AK013]|nr:hypothetical protein [Pedobacter sp. AK013]
MTGKLQFILSLYLFSFWSAKTVLKGTCGPAFHYIPGNFDKDKLI